MSERFDDDGLRAAYAPLRASSTEHRPDCPAPDALIAAARGEGLEAERLLVLDRALRCPACRRELALLHAVSGTGVQPQSSARRFSWPRVAPLAAAASIVLMVGIFGADQWRQRNDPTLRAGNGTEPVLSAPTQQAALTGSITFTWRPVARALRYTLEVFAADGTVLLSATTTDTASVASFPNVTPTEARWSVRAHLDDGSERRSEMRVLQLR
ncbi:MAG: hypothetical protein ACRENP_15235 [Longimicrobiales bacterium]